MCEGPPDEVPETRGRPRAYFKITAEGERVAKEDRVSMGGLFGFVPAKVRAMLAAFLPEVVR